MKVNDLSTVLAVGATMMALAPPALGQSIAERVASVDDGKVRLSFASRPDVCGDGRGSISFDGGRGWQLRHGHSDVDWECKGGPVRVVLRLSGGEVTDIDTYVGGRWRSATASTVDLGAVSAVQAARYMMSLARGSDGAAGDAILPAMLADSVTIWPELLEIAKDGGQSEKVRKNAVFWLSQEAAAAAGEGLNDIAIDDSENWEIRKMAIFGLSQRPKDEGVPALIQLARTSDDTHVVRQALFWLGQSEDPRAIALFEDLLTKH